MKAVYGTRKHRAADLEAGDVTRNAYGKWAVVTKVETVDLYTMIDFDIPGGRIQVRDVHLVDVQVVKPS